MDTEEELKDVEHKLSNNLQQSSVLTNCTRKCHCEFIQLHFSLITDS